MAIAITERHSYFGNYFNTNSSPTFTPAAGSVLIVVGYHGSPPANISLTGFGSWSEIYSYPDSREFKIFALAVGDSPTADSITFNSNSGNQKGSFWVGEITGADGSSNTSAFAQVNSADYYQSSLSTNTYSANLNSFASSENATLVIANISKNASSGSSMAVEAGYTAYGSPDYTNIGFLDDEDLSPSFDVTSSFDTAVITGLEIVAAGSGGGGGGGNTGPSIDNIDGDNEVSAGQQNVVITGTNIENATSATLGGAALTIV